MKFVFVFMNILFGNGTFAHNYFDATTKSERNENKWHDICDFAMAHKLLWRTMFEQLTSVCVFGTVDSANE